MNKQALLRLAAARRHAASGSGRRIRQQARLSLQEVADAIGVGLATISRWETGHRQPRGEAAIRWAELLTDLQQETEAIA